MSNRLKPDQQKNHDEALQKFKKSRKGLMDKAKAEENALAKKRETIWDASNKRHRLPRGEAIERAQRNRE